VSRGGVFCVTEIDEQEKKRLALDVESLYNTYGPMVLRRCRSLLIDEEQALDAMQETFVKLLRYRDRLTDAAPSSMLYCIATNVCLNMMRGSRRRPQSAGDEALERIASTEDVEARVLDRHLLDSIFSKERASTRTMAVMHYVDGMTLEEVARHTGLSVSGVRKRLRLLKERLRTTEEA
jgi:RNA polymerase sigma-70 factor (ECF subfamily)